VTTNPVKKTKSNFGNLTALVKDSAAKRRPPAAGKGRPKGSKNKTTALLKERRYVQYDEVPPVRRSTVPPGVPSLYRSGFQ
jgi:hypothetical protein